MIDEYEKSKANIIMFAIFAVAPLLYVIPSLRSDYQSIVSQLGANDTILYIQGYTTHAMLLGLSISSLVIIFRLPLSGKAAMIFQIFSIGYYVNSDWINDYSLRLFGKDQVSAYKFCSKKNGHRTRRSIHIFAKEMRACEIFKFQNQDLSRNEVLKRLEKRFASLI